MLEEIDLSKDLAIFYGYLQSVATKVESTKQPGNISTINVVS